MSDRGVLRKTVGAGFKEDCPPGGVMEDRKYVLIGGESFSLSLVPPNNIL